jgi:hypothetical protein
MDKAFLIGTMQGFEGPWKWLLGEPMLNNLHSLNRKIMTNRLDTYLIIQEELLLYVFLP